MSKFQVAINGYTSISSCLFKSNHLRFPLLPALNLALSNSKNRQAKRSHFTQVGTETKTRCKGNEMNALVMSTAKQSVVYKHVPVPSGMQKDEVCIKVQYSAATSTDLRIIFGDLGAAEDGIILGRELSGVVYEVGKDVTKVGMGDAVVVAPCYPQTICRYCSNENQHCCVKENSAKTFGMSRHGAWASYAVVPASMVYKVDKFCLQQAAILPQLAQVMCCLSRMDIKPDLKILIQGCGLPGALFAHLLYQSGHKHLKIWEDNPNRLNFLRNMDYPIIEKSEIKEKFDLVIVNGCGAYATQKAFHSLGHNGILHIFGQPGKDGNNPNIELPISDFCVKGITMKAEMGMPVNPSNVPTSIATQILNFENLGVAVYSMNEYEKALTQLSTGDVNAVVFSHTK